VTHELSELHSVAFTLMTIVCSLWRQCALFVLLSVSMADDTLAQCKNSHAVCVLHCMELKDADAAAPELS